MRFPPFCPNRQCQHHHDTPRERTGWWVRDGTYTSRRAGTVQRFRCIVCGRRFSTTTFSVDYYTKKRINLLRLRRLITNGCSIRAAARCLFVSPTTISHRVMLLCRQSIAVHAGLTDHITPHEDLVADGFQSFWVSQYHPNAFNILVGAHSQYLYAMSTVSLKRCGRMRPSQRVKRDRIEARYPTDPRGLEHAFQELLLEGERLWNRCPREARVLRTDLHQTYTRCLARCSVGNITHITVSSKVPRTSENPLFAVNYMDREIRKDLSEHHRETMCFARSASMSTARMWIYMVYHNIDKAFRESPRVGCSHAEVAGIPDRERRRVRRRMCTERAFLSRSGANHTLRRVWAGMIPTPEMKNRTNRRITPAYAMA